MDINQSQNNDYLNLKGNIKGVNIYCLVDTEATLSILHPAKFNQILEELRLELHPAKIADGGSIVSEGYSFIP